MTLLRWLRGTRGAVHPGVLVPGAVALSAVAVALAFALSGTAPAGNANVWVDTNGGTCARQTTAGAYSDAAACSSLAAAYAAASSGDTVRVRTGTYGAQYLAGARDAATGNNTPVGVGNVTFIGESLPVLNVLGIGGTGITIDGFDIRGGHAQVALGWGTTNGTLKNSRVGSVEDDKGAIIGADGVTIDNVDFHDVTYSGVGDVHGECLFWISPQDGVLRNSTFTNCFVMDINLNPGSGIPDPFTNVTVENNVFGHSTQGSTGSSWAAYAWVIGATTLDASLPACAQNVQNAYAVWLDGWRVVNNTFEGAIILGYGNGCAPSNAVWANNVGFGWGCMTGVTFAGNVGQSCSGTDTSTALCGQITCPFGFVDRVNWNFHLTAGSPAINAASATYAPTTDSEGNPRVGAPDAGAYEYQG